MRKSSLLMKTILCFVFYFGCLQHAFSQNSLVVSIPFKVNSYTVNKEYQLLLDTLVSKCRANSHFYIRMFAFTDTTGSEQYNDMLSQKRGEAVYNYLAARIPLSNKNIYYSWQGEFEEKYDLHFAEAHVQQRFVDMKVNFYKK